MVCKKRLPLIPSVASLSRSLVANLIRLETSTKYGKEQSELGETIILSVCLLINYLCLVFFQDSGQIDSYHQITTQTADTIKDLRWMFLHPKL